MFQLYTLTKTAHALINQLRQKGLEIGNIESDYYLHLTLDDWGNPSMCWLPILQRDLLPENEIIALDPRNIQKLLIDLNLGENQNYKIQKKSGNLVEIRMGMRSRLLSNQEYGLERMNAPMTQAKVLSDKWFSLCESDEKVLPSLWHRDEESVLSKLIEVLEGKLENI